MHINEHYIFFISLINTFIFFQIIKTIISECNKTNPILTENGCELKYCTSEQFTSKQCQINNTIIKTQWLNNIIILGTNSYSYVDIVITSTNDLIIETSTYPSTGERIFYGIKNNGRPYFINNQYYKIFNLENLTQYEKNYKRTESTVFSVLIGENSTKEYIVSFTKFSGYFELYDFEFNNIYLSTTTKIFNSFGQISLLFPLSILI